MSAIDNIITRILSDEGGIKDVGDGKGITRYGQTPSWLVQFNLPVPETKEDAAANYVKWMSITGLDQIVGTVADSLAQIVIDIAVMSDHRKAFKALQTVLGVTVDGVLGRETLNALSRVDRLHTACLVIAWDMEYQGRLITLNPTGRAQYAGGWASRMARHVRRLA